MNRSPIGPRISSPPSSRVARSDSANCEREPTDCSRARDHDVFLHACARRGVAKARPRPDPWVLDDRTNSDREVIRQLAPGPGNARSPNTRRPHRRRQRSRWPVRGALWAHRQGADRSDQLHALVRGSEPDRPGVRRRAHPARPLRVNRQLVADRLPLAIHLVVDRLQVTIHDKAARRVVDTRRYASRRSIASPTSSGSPTGAEAAAEDSAAGGWMGGGASSSGGDTNGGTSSPIPIVPCAGSSARAAPGSDPPTSPPTSSTTAMRRWGRRERARPDVARGPKSFPTRSTSPSDERPVARRGAALYAGDVRLVQNRAGARFSRHPARAEPRHNPSRAATGRASAS